AKFNLIFLKAAPLGRLLAYPSLYFIDDEKRTTYRIYPILSNNYKNCFAIVKKYVITFLPGSWIEG
ncbi:MAG: hypothetical protein ACHP6H_01745, partial [Legionellales bacterium]